MTPEEVGLWSAFGFSVVFYYLIMMARLLMGSYERRGAFLFDLFPGGIFIRLFIKYVIIKFAGGFCKVIRDEYRKLR